MSFLDEMSVWTYTYEGIYKQYIFSIGKTYFKVWVDYEDCIVGLYDKKTDSLIKGGSIFSNNIGSPITITNQEEYEIWAYKLETECQKLIETALLNS